MTSPLYSELPQELLLEVEPMRPAGGRNKVSGKHYSLYGACRTNAATFALKISSVLYVGVKRCLKLKLGMQTIDLRLIVE